MYSPEASVKGCVFHLAQALYLLIKTIRLKTTYEANVDVHTLLQKTFPLPFLPAEDFKQLKKKSATDMTNNYLDRPGWIAMYGASTLRKINKNINDTKGYHNKLNQLATYHSTCWINYSTRKATTSNHKRSSSKRRIYTLPIQEDQRNQRPTDEAVGRLQTEEHHNTSLTGCLHAIYAPIKE